MQTDTAVPTFLEAHRLLPIEAVVKVVGLDASSVRRRVAAGTFPKPVRLSFKCARWPAGEVHAWLQAQANAREMEAA